MSKFFKISIVILLVFAAIGIAGAISFNKFLTKKNLDIENFKSQNSDDYWSYSIVDFNKAGDFHMGFKYLDKAVALDPKKHLGYRGWIRLRKLRDYDKALIDFDRLDSLTPNIVDAPWGEDIDFLRGECYFGNEEYGKAIQLFNRSIENQGEDWVDIQTFVYLGLCQYRLKNYEQAKQEFKRALKHSDNTCEAHLGLAKAYKMLGNLKESKIHIRKAEESIAYKRDDPYNEFLNEIYLSQILEFKQELGRYQ